jgi:hypothetical protein
MNITKRMIALSALAAALGVAAGEGRALARTVHASAGAASEGIQAAGFVVGGTFNEVVWASTGGPATWVMPIPFDKFGTSRNITVRGTVYSGGSLTCVAGVIDTAGAVASVSQNVAFPVTSTVTSVKLSLSSVPTGGQGILSCQFTGNGVAGLLGVDYSP